MIKDRPTGEKYSKEYKNKLELSEFKKDAWFIVRGCECRTIKS